MAYYVQYFKSTDTGAPTLTGQAGSLITLLNTCLINGYSTLSVSSITQTANLATVTLAVANSTLVTGNWITIAGASQSDYNGTFQITVLSSTQFTYTVANNPVSPATGTITYKKAGLQWSSPYTTTNVAVYRSNDNSSNRYYLRIQETGVTAGGQKEAVATGYETMVDHSTGTGQFPLTTQNTNGGEIWVKSITADSTARAWYLIGDGRTFYLFMVNGTNTMMFGFGHFIPNRAGDGFNTFVGGTRTANTTGGTNEASFGCSQNFYSGFTTTSGLHVPRSYTQVGASTAAGLFAFGLVNGSGYGVFGWSTGSQYDSWGPSYPNPLDLSLHFLPINIGESNSTFQIFRGKMPGMYTLWTSANASSFFSAGDQIVGVPGLGTAVLTGMNVSGFYTNNSVARQGILFIDTLGPWT